MLFKIQPVVKVVVRWDDNEYEAATAYQLWLRENKIYRAARGGGGSWQRNEWLYSQEDAEKIEEHLSKVGRKCQILKS